MCVIIFVSTLLLQCDNTANDRKFRGHSGWGLQYSLCILYIQYTLYIHKCSGCRIVRELSFGFSPVPKDL